MSLLFHKPNTTENGRGQRMFCLIRLILSIVLLLLVATSWRQLHFASATNDKGSPFFSLSRWGFRRAPSSSSWSSLLTLDPSKILPTLVKHGGLLVPDYIEKDLESLAQVCHVEASSLDVANRKLELVNFTVALSNETQQQEDYNAALRIGRVYIEWDSYLRPCVNIQVEQVEILLEFTNFLLTRNNWHELNDAGFPPRLLLESSGTSDSDAPSSTFVRFSNVEFLGNVVVRIQSRPLDHKPLTNDIMFDFATLKDLTLEIQALAESNKSNNNADERPGCTTDELYNLTVDWFMRKLEGVLQKILLEFAFAPEGGIKSARRQVQEHRQQLAKNARSMLKEYATSAGNKILQDHEGSFSRLKDLVPKEHLDHLEQVSKKQLDRVADGSLFNKILKKAFDKKDKPPIGVDEDTYEFPEDIMFPDL